MNESVVMGKNTNPVRRYQFDPMGISHELQQAITDLMHDIVIQKGNFTLAELGYLNMSSIAFVNDHVEVKVYFAPELATVTNRAMNGGGNVIPNPELNMFKNYLFVGDVASNCTFVNMTAPRYTIERNNRDQLAVEIKDGKKTKEEIEVMAVYCNLDLILAAYYDADIMSPDFSVTYQTIGNSNKNNAENTGIMISMGATQEFPVKVYLEAPVNSSGYMPENAIPYLLAKVQARKDAKQTKKELARKVSDHAQEAVKEKSKKLDIWKKYR